jgi:hypothetical protein
MEKHKSLILDRVQVGFYSALLRLMEDRPYSEICVTHIAREAGRDRTTFYRYFEFKEDLLARCLFTFMDFIFSEIGFPDRWDRLVAYDKIHKVHGILERNSRPLRVFFGPHSPDFIKDIFTKTINDFCRKALQSFYYQSLDRDMIFFLGEILGNCFMGAIDFWVGNHDKYSRDLMEKYLYQYGIEGISGLFGTETEMEMESLSSDLDKDESLGIVYVY